MIDMISLSCLHCWFNPLVSSDEDEGLGVTKNPLEKVTAGLLNSDGQTLPLQAVHVRCKLMDLLSQVKYFSRKMSDCYTIQISILVINVHFISKKP